MKNNIHLEKELAEIIVGFRPGGPNEARQTLERWRKTAEAFVTALNGSDAKGLSNPVEIIALIDAYVNVHVRRSQTWRPESIALDSLIADKARCLDAALRKTPIFRKALCDAFAETFLDINDAKKRKPGACSPVAVRLYTAAYAAQAEKDSAPVQ